LLLKNGADLNCLQRMLGHTRLDTTGVYLQVTAEDGLQALGEWTLIVAGARIDKEINGNEVTHALLIPLVDGFGPEAKVYWDDVGLHWIADPD